MLKYSPIFLLFVLLYSCSPFTTGMSAEERRVKDSLDRQQVKAYITKELDKDSKFWKTFEHKSKKSLPKNISDLYTKKEQGLVWQNVSERTPSPQVKAYIETLKNARKEGLNSKDYLLAPIEKLFTIIDTTQQENRDSIYLNKMSALDVLLTTSFWAYTDDLLSTSMQPRRDWDVEIRKRETAKLLEEGLANSNIKQVVQSFSPKHKRFKDLQAKLLTYQDIQAKGGWKKVPTGLKKGSTSDKVKILTNRLASVGDIPANLANTTKFTDEVTAGIKKYQARHGLGSSGALNGVTLKSMNVPIEKRVEQINLNLQRHRWMADDFGDRYVWVNIPEYLIRVFDKGKEVSVIRGVVGNAKTATPILVNKPMKNIIFSPTWTIPTSIAREEMEYILKNPAVLIVADVEVFVDGKLVSDPTSIDWANISLSRVRMRQKPKKTNSMGGAKFMFENGESIYLHDTPNKVDFKKSVRADSHGCVRVGDPSLLAQKLLVGKGNWTIPKIKAAMRSGKQQFVTPPKGVKVNLVYLTAWVDDKGDLRFGRDIYGHDRRQLKKLASK